MKRVQKHRVAHLGVGHAKTVQAEADVAACLQALSEQKGTKPVGEEPKAAESDHAVAILCEIADLDSNGEAKIVFSFRDV